MNKIIKARWLILAIWIISAALLSHFMPNLQRLAVEKGQPKIPLVFSSCKGSQLMNEMNQVEGLRQSTLLAVFISKDKLSNSQLGEIKQQINGLDSDKGNLHILKIVSPFDSEDLSKEMISEDNTTLLVQINVDKTNTGIDEIRTNINQQLEDSSVEHYLTGGDLINSDMEATMHAGSKRTEIFTYVLIFIILLLVFRSPITPLVSLLSIGLTYACSLGIITQLADKWNIPYASTTQTFLILVLFGIGTDYNILLMLRFRQELRRRTVNDAIITTYRTAGRTVLLSSLTVLIGFAVLFLAKFSIYQAVSAVAIAVVILVMELTTLLPFFMKLFGPRLFWPRKSDSEENANAVWAKVTAMSVAKPVRFLLLTLILTLPLVLLYKSNLSYDNLHEVNGSYASVKAVDLCSDKFGPGKIFPLSVLIQSDSPMDHNEALAQLDEIDEALSGISGVQSVYSVTRPKGAKLENTYIKEQTLQISDDLKVMMNGLDQINIGLAQLAGISPQLRDGITESSGGLTEIRDGLSSVNDYIAGLSSNQSSEIFYIPKEQLHQEFQKTLEVYMSEDYKITELKVYLSIDPYSEQAIDVVSDIKSTVENQLQTGTLAGAKLGITGVSSQNRDLSLVSGSDLTRSKLIMLIGIAIVLIFITRSVQIPIYILVSLIISYYTAYAATQYLFSRLSGVEHLTWNVPFFTFIILIPLGVDYSIFLITRYREAGKMPRGKAILYASANTGTSIMSAAIILAANFAALYLSGITSYDELATVVIIGLLLLAFLFMPVFLPACISISDKLHRLIQKEQSEQEDTLNK